MPLIRFLGQLALAAALLLPQARADALQDRFETVWESLWYQGGTPLLLSRWQGDIQVRIQGRNVAMHRARILEALRTVAAETGIRIQDVTDGGGTPNLEVRLVGDDEGTDRMACYVRTLESEGPVIRKQELVMRQGAVYYCALHEAMHVMGIQGHPRAGTVLSYFHQRVDRLTDMDQLLVRSWYSSAMKPGMTPLEVLPVLTAAVVDSANPPAGDAAQAARRRFHADVMREMAAFASGEGEVPVVIKRSGTASAEAMDRGRKLMRLFLGLAYMTGQIVDEDPPAAARWTERAALDGLAYAQWLMGEVARRGYGRAASRADAYFWYALAAAQGIEQAKASVARLEAVMTPEDVDAARKRVADFR